MLWDISRWVGYLVVEIGDKMNFLFKFFILTCLLATSSFASSDALLKQKGSEINLSSEITTQKVMRLDDAFLIQLYSSWKASGPLDHKTNSWFQKIVDHNFKTALLEVNQINEIKVQKIKKASELYLLFKVGLYQTFLGEWIAYSAQGNFLKTELGLSLDQVIAPHSSNIFVSSGFSLTPQMSDDLSKIESIPNQLNYSLQALKNLKQGDKAAKWIGKLKVTDDLRVQLAYSAILAYAKQGKIGASGTIVKKIIEPWIESNSDSEDIAFYYLTLGRLLYQANAFSESISYYKLVPESSKYFLEARTESLWGRLQMRDFSKSAGELASLKMTVFSDQFYPEIFLASAIGHTMLCQFTDAKNSIHSFIKSNKKWGKKIDLALSSDNPEPVRETYSINQKRNAIKSLKKDQAFFKIYKITNYDNQLLKRTIYTDVLLKKEKKNQWRNRYKLLDAALYKMKFVRIELLSRMKAVADGLSNKIAGQDSVSRYQAATLKGGQIAFPYDGMPWGDELFNMSADVLNQCIQGKFYVK